MLIYSVSKFALNADQGALRLDYNRIFTIIWLSPCMGIRAIFEPEIRKVCYYYYYYYFLYTPRKVQ